MVLSQLLAAGLFLASTTAVASPSSEFGRYPAVAGFSGNRAPIRATDAKSRQFRTALADAADGDIDFNGRYILAEIGCGAGCIRIAAIDAADGHIAWFPVTISNWPKERVEPVEYRVDSRLIVIYGQLGEQGSTGPHRFVFDGRRFLVPGVNSRRRKN